jgi:3-oxoacyl-[acyl-carrier-protein] synthase II
MKGHMGHTLGASGAIESIATIFMARMGFMAPTKNLTIPDPELPSLDLIREQPREKKFHIGMCNNFAFGGVNTSLIFKKI